MPDPASVGHPWPAPAHQDRGAGGRLPQVDNLRTFLVAWIIGGHGLLGYSTIGGWEYEEVKEVTFGAKPELVLTAILGPSALLVIGAFFLIAGLFTPQALARRGPGRFVRDRLLRLLLPYVAFALLLWPLCMWLVYRTVGSPVSYWWVFTRRDPLLDAGPLWFVAVLAIFSAVYAGWYVLCAGRSDVDDGLRARPVAPPGGVQLLGLAVGLTVATFVLRLWLPARSAQVGDLHLWQWPQCAAMFCLGIACANRGLAAHVPDRLRRRCGYAVLFTVALLPVLAMIVGISELGKDVGPFLGGWSWQALLTASVEGTLVVAGSVWLLGTAQRWLPQRGRLAAAAARSAYAAFALQGPVLLTLALAIRPLVLPAEVKSFVVAAAGIAVTFWVAWLAVTRTRLGRLL